MSGTTCFDCGDFLDAIDLEIGDIMECDSCGSELEVVTLDPFKAMALAEEK